MKVRIGLLGTGHLGKIHLRLLKEIEKVELVGFFDNNPKTAAAVSEEYGVKAFDSIEELLAASDAVDIVTPTLAHYDCAKAALAAGKHFFIEKPLTRSVEEAEDLIRLIQETGLKAQVGHVERFNPALLAVGNREMDPKFIEGHRLALYNPRGTDVSVVLDLMIHDLDVVLSLVRSEVTHISASGVAVVSSTPDIANARLEFANGCVANLTASRISVKNMRRLRIFEKSGYLAVDFLKKQSEIFQLTEDPEIYGKAPMKFEMDTGNGKKYLVYESPRPPPVNAIKMELEEFADAILLDRPIRVAIKDGYDALKTAHEIVAKIEERLEENG